MSNKGHPGAFATKPTERLLEAAGQSKLRKTIGVLDLTALGIGAIIGTGIFVIIGEAIGDSGPAIVLSFALAGITCVFSALSYSELASAIPFQAVPTHTPTRPSASWSPSSSAGT